MNIFKNAMRFVLAVVLLSISAVSLAHHGYGGRYDQTRVAELEGEVVRKLWQNPHIRLSIKDANGDVWALEGGTASNLISAGFTTDLVNIGDHIRVAGFPSMVGRKEMIVRNILLPSGSEMVMDPSRIGPRWQTTDLILGQNPPRVTVGDASAPELGIFRTWITVTRDPASKGIFPEAANADLVWRYPLTPEAYAMVESFDAATDNPLKEYCIGKGMPMIMDQPFATVFTDHGHRIVLQLEEFDAVRTIHMTEIAPPTESSKFGFSTGYWDGETLVVETSHISWPFFSQIGVPQTEQSTMVERFTPVDQGARLNYQLIAKDPEVFTEPVVLSKYWISDPSSEIGEYNCVE